MNLNQEERRSRIKLNRPFAKAAEKLRRDALSRGDYDPAQLFAWGQMMAISVLEMLKAVEARFGREGQAVRARPLGGPTAGRGAGKGRGGAPRVPSLTPPLAV